MQFKENFLPIILGAIGLLQIVIIALIPRVDNQLLLWFSGGSVLVMLISAYLLYRHTEQKAQRVTSVKLPNDTVYNNHLKHITDKLSVMVGNPQNDTFTVSEELLQEFVTVLAEETRELYFGEKTPRPHPKASTFPLNYKQNCKICKAKDVACQDGRCSATTNCGLHVEVWQKM